MRIESIVFATLGNAVATAQNTIFSLRRDAGAAIAITSTPILLQGRCATPATASAWDRVVLPVGQELLSTSGVFGVTARATYTTNAPTWDVIINGFEY